MFLFNRFILLVAFASVAVVAQHDPNYCYATDPIRSQLNRFSSRVAYETIRGRIVNPGVSSKNDFTLLSRSIEKCSDNILDSLYASKILVLLETCC